MISQTAEYALRATVCLAAEFPRPMTVRRIAVATRVPTGYLSKVLQALVRGGLVQSQRGLHGGFTLLRAPDKTTIWQVISVVDPSRRIHHCPLNLPSHGETLCPLHRRLDEAAAVLESQLGTTTIAQILADRSCTKPLCETAATERRTPLNATGH